MVEALDRLKPYSGEVPGSLLKVEDVNIGSHWPREVHFMSISAKRYAIFARHGAISRVLKCSQHGLGHLLDPRDTDDRSQGTNGERGWIVAYWERLIRQVLGLSVGDEPA